MQYPRSLKWLFILLISFVFTHLAQSQLSHKFSILIDYHYGNSFISEPQEVDLNGRYGYGIEMYYHFGNKESKLGTALGLSYSRVGKSRELLWTDATPEREMTYGKFPIHYDMWTDVHYLSLPFMLQYSLSTNSFLATEISLDYPIGSSFYSKRSSDDGVVVEVNKDGFSSTKAYPWNTSMGWGIRVGKAIGLTDKTNLLIGLKFKVYTIVAARSNDYFPHEEYERPYSMAMNVGVSF